ncbi:hypothetical protein [Prevotella intermedia]|uniref:hypothetical protein n=1 Tax=Prevotella intermedia TaxID=28131 RepID=UPI0012B62A38|nr:hypothetical protein [Prevotella intermedia]
MKLSTKHTPTNLRRAHQNSGVDTLYAPSVRLSRPLEGGRLFKSFNSSCAI